MPITPDDDPKLQKLDKELKAARQEFEDDYNPKPKQNYHSEGASIGYEFLAYVVSGGLLGYGIDHFMGWAPFGLMVGMVFGLVGGVFRANHRTKQSHKKTVKKA
jgi:ATP synthase protein I